MTPREKAIIVRHDQERRALELIQKQKIQDEKRCQSFAEKLMKNALSESKDVTYIIGIPKEDANRVTEILASNGFTEENFWKIRVDTFREKDRDFHDYESTSIALDVIPSKQGT